MQATNGAVFSVPTPEMLTGDFSKWVDSNGKLIPGERRRGERRRRQDRRSWCHAGVVKVTQRMHNGLAVW